jgi:hypothetical protein
MINWGSTVAPLVPRIPSEQSFAQLPAILAKATSLYLCEDYGCARKGGLSPRLDEHF